MAKKANRHALPVSDKAGVPARPRRPRSLGPCQKREGSRRGCWCTVTRLKEKMESSPSVVRARAGCRTALDGSCSDRDYLDVSWRGG